LFDERERVAIAWADRVTRNEAHADAALWHRVGAVFDDAEIVELTLAACLFNFLNRFNDTMWLELDDGAPSNARLSVPEGSFRRYAEAMYGSEG
jgi:alkylhydroperoxidase family enzyme